MKGMVMLNGKLHCETLADPEPATGQLLTRPLACGVCGSDLHAREHTRHLCDLLHRTGFNGFMDPGQPVVMGHEFCCEVLESPAGSKHAFAPGQRVVALPFVSGPRGIELIGYSNHFNGAFAELMLLESDMAFAVPDHVPTDIAALTEPFSVAVHAVASARPDSDCAFTIVGCGPVGLFIITRLKALGLGPIMAIEPNPGRRQLAEALGADMVLSPGDQSSEQWWTEQGLPLGLSDSAALPASARKRTRAVIFECVGKPGMIMNIAQSAPVGATVVVVGTCMETDNIEPAFLLQKSLSLQFVFAYSKDEFAEAFTTVCQSPEALAPFITQQVPLEATDQAFNALAGDGNNIKVIVNPNT